MSENKITKKEIVENIFGESELEKRDVQKIVDSFLNQLKLSLQKGAVIELRGFGTFEAKLRKGRDGAINPKTGEKVTVKDHYVASFRAGKELKNSLLELPVDGIL